MPQLVRTFYKKITKLYITLIRNMPTLYRSIYKNWKTIFYSRIKHIISPTNISQVGLSFWLRPMVQVFLSGYISFVVKDSKDGWQTITIFIMSYIIVSIIISFLMSGYIALNQEFKKKSTEKKQAKFDLGFSEIENISNYISIDNLDEYGKKNGLYHKVPEAIWTEYRDAIKDCNTKNHLTKLNQKLIEIRSEKFKNLVRLHNIIVGLLFK